MAYIIAVLSQKIQHPHSVVLVEAMATSRAITFMKELCVLQVEFERDFQ